MLLDLNMPKTSGFDVLRWVREQSFLKGLRVVVMTGSKDSEDVQRAYDLGADSYLVKPTRFADLVTMTQSLKSYCGGGTVDLARDRSPSGPLPAPPREQECSL
jgi:DNA-binding response OmpR family regulator